jgi:hypothetical protein
MRTNLKNNLWISAILLITSSISMGPDVHLTTTSKSTGSSERFYGGAYLIFAGKFGGEITQKEIAEHQAVTVDGCAVGSRIFKFTLDITHSGKTTSLQSESSKLTRTMVTQLSSLQPGDQFEFRKIKAYLPNGKDIVDVMGKKFVVV